MSSTKRSCGGSVVAYWRIGCHLKYGASIPLVQKKQPQQPNKSGNNDEQLKQIFLKKLLPITLVWCHSLCKIVQTKLTFVRFSYHYTMYGKDVQPHKNVMCHFITCMYLILYPWWQSPEAPVTILVSFACSGWTWGIMAVVVNLPPVQQIMPLTISNQLYYTYSRLKTFD